MTTAKFIQQGDRIKALVVFKGITTDDGDPGGAYLICDKIIGINDFLTNKMIVILSGTSAFEDDSVAGIDNTTGEVDFVSGFSSQILKNTEFAIVSTISPKAGISVPAPTILSISPVDFWSPVKNGFAVGTVATTIMLGSVALVIPGSATIQRAVAMLKYRAIDDNSAADNYLSGAQEIELTGLGNAINLVDVQCFVPASSRDGGDVVIGDIDLSGLISVGSNSYALRWPNSLAFGSSINFYDVQVGIRVWW